MEIPMRTVAKKPRGRPRKPENTALIDALIGRQDAMSRRTARRIEQILVTHVPLEGAQILWRGICRQVRAGIGAIPGLAAARIAPLAEPTAVRVLEDLIDEVLSEIGAGPDDGSPLPKLPPAEEPPTVKTSHTLAPARVQSARLQTYLIDLRARVHPFRRSDL